MPEQGKPVGCCIALFLGNTPPRIRNVSNNSYAGNLPYVWIQKPINLKWS